MWGSDKARKRGGKSVHNGASKQANLPLDARTTQVWQRTWQDGWDHTSKASFWGRGGARRAYGGEPGRAQKNGLADCGAPPRHGTCNGPAACRPARPGSPPRSQSQVVEHQRREALGVVEVEVVPCLGASCGVKGPHDVDQGGRTVPTSFKESLAGLVSLRSSVSVHASVQPARFDVAEPEFVSKSAGRANWRPNPSSVRASRVRAMSSQCACRSPHGHPRISADMGDAPRVSIENGGRKPPQSAMNCFRKERPGRLDRSPAPLWRARPCARPPARRTPPAPRALARARRTPARSSKSTAWDPTSRRSLSGLAVLPCDAAHPDRGNCAYERGCV